MKFIGNKKFPDFEIGEYDQINFDFSRHLSRLGDTIASASWSVSGSGISISNATKSDTIASAYVTATNSGDYTVSCQITRTNDSGRNVAKAQLRVLKSDEFD